MHFHCMSPLIQSQLEMKVPAHAAIDIIDLCQELHTHTAKIWDLPK